MIKDFIKYGEAEVIYKNKQLLSKNPKLYNLFWETTLKCNAKCKHCGSNARENININEELTTQEIKDTFNGIAKKYHANEILINVTGGEPLLRKDLFEVMTYARNLGFHWGMTTNGILINNEIIKKMKSSGMETISISLDGLEHTHNEFRGVPNSYEKIIENIKNLKKANFLDCLQITTVINKSNINELEKLYSILQNLNINSWRILSIEPIGRANENKDLLLKKDDYEKLLYFIKNKRKTSKFEIKYGCTHFLGMKFEKEVRPHMFFCVAGYTTASILYNGDIYVCPSVERRKELIQGNVKTDDFIYVWENKFKWFRDENKLKCKECDNCKNWKYCSGDSLHTWDFDNKKTKICINKMLGGI